VHCHCFHQKRKYIITSTLHHLLARSRFPANPANPSSPTLQASQIPKTKMQDGNQWTYTSLTEALHHRTIILRVHTTPHNPLEQGFTARNPAFNRLTIEQYHDATSSLGGRWAEGPYMRDVIIDHINQLVRPPQPPSLLHCGHGSRFRLGPRPFPLGGPRMKAETDELTPWISTTANLDWAIWYIAKLLSQMTHHGMGYRYDQVKLSVISISTDRTHNKELYVAPFLFRPDETKYKCQVDKERYNRARKSAIAAKEVLFYGRIFRESILADLTFTKEVSAPLGYLNQRSIIK
jgi:hypothetical protein